MHLSFHILNQVSHTECYTMGKTIDSCRAYPHRGVRNPLSSVCDHPPPPRTALPDPLCTASFRILSSLLNSVMRELLHRGRGMKRLSSWSAICCRAVISSWFSAGWASSWQRGITTPVSKRTLQHHRETLCPFPTSSWVSGIRIPWLLVHLQAEDFCPCM